MASPNVSVVVPIYNTEPYLERCLESLVNQSLRDVELVLIDNACTDQSPSIIDRYANKDSRIRVYTHKKNVGVGGARNTALELATGDYVTFVDSDDWVDTMAFEILYNKANEQDCDLVICGTHYVDVEGEPTEKIHSYLSEHMLHDGSAFDCYLEKEPQRMIFNSTWGKLYRRTLFTQSSIKYSQEWMFEDLSVTARLIFLSKKVLLVPQALYYYRQRPHSMTADLQLSQINGYLKEFRTLNTFLRENHVYESHKGKFWRLFYRTCVVWFYYTVVYQVPEDDYMQCFMEWCQRIYQDLDEEELGCLSSVASENRLKLPFLVFCDPALEGIPKLVSESFLEILKVSAVDLDSQ